MIYLCAKTLGKFLLLLLVNNSQITKSGFIGYCRKSEMFASLDKNKDKVVSDIEVTSKAHLAFQALDRNHDGFISKKEFSKISKNLNNEQASLSLIH